MNVNLHIERLILDGVPIHRYEGAYVQAAIEAELARLLTRDGVSEGLQSHEYEPRARLRTPQIDLSHGGSPARVGEQIASAIYDVLGTNPASSNQR